MIRGERRYSKDSRFSYNKTVGRIFYERTRMKKERDDRVK